tara:strand:+ start:754 stop:1719 length:966 start_codon:yes stop_codon:yes gene_type:complete
MAKEIQIFCTLGPKTLNKKFLNNIKGKVSLLRINLSHVSLDKLKQNINLIKKYTSVPICVDTEGAQIRTKSPKKKYYRKNQIGYIEKNKNFHLYPNDVFEKLKTGDMLDIGFQNLLIKILKKDSKIKFKVIKPGILEGNKGVHVKNRGVKLNSLTEKDLSAIKIAKKMNVKNFALSFTNSHYDVLNFEKLLPNYTKIYKLETRNAIKNLNKILSKGKNFLIDRGDLSKDTGIENIPYLQRFILKKAKKRKNKIYIATNFLESMIDNSSPTRGEANDVYNSLELGAAGLVLAAETAIGKYPLESINFLRRMIKVFKNRKKIG